jgi:hypothetical protein
MALRSRILGWLRQTPDGADGADGADEKLADAEAELTEDAYQGAADDMRVDARLGARPGEFEGDQSGPR